MGVKYLPKFIRMFNKLDPALQDEVVEKIELFKNPKNHKLLKVHKLKGRLQGSYSFSIDYKNRIVFEYETKEIALLMAVGDHDVYA